MLNLRRIRTELGSGTAFFSSEYLNTGRSSLELINILSSGAYQDIVVCCMLLVNKKNP